MDVAVKDAQGRVLGYLPQTPTSEGGGASATLVSAPGSRPQTIAAGADFPVPAYVVGKNSLQIWLDGMKCDAGPDPAQAQYMEVGAVGSSANIIRWHDAIPPDMGISVRID